MAGLGDLGAVDLDHGLAGGDGVALGDEAGEAVALHVNRVDAHVAEHLKAVLAHKAHGVGHEHAHGAGDGRVDDVGVGPDGAALAHHLGAEDGIGHVGHLDGLAADGGAQHAGGLLGLDGGGLGRGGRLRLLLECVEKSHGILLWSSRADWRCLDLVAPILSFFGCERKAESASESIFCRRSSPKDGRQRMGIRRRPHDNALDVIGKSCRSLRLGLLGLGLVGHELDGEGDGGGHEGGHDGDDHVGDAGAALGRVDVGEPVEDA